MTFPTLYSILIQLTASKILRAMSLESNCSIAPVPLYEIGGVKCHASHKALGTEQSHWSTRRHCAFTTETDLDVANAQSKQGGHCVIQKGAVCTIKFGNGSKNESKWHILEEVHMATTLEEERIWVLGVAGGVLLCVELVANPLTVLDALVNNAIAEEKQISGKRNGPEAGDSCDGVSGCDR